MNMDMDMNKRVESLSIKFSTKSENILKIDDDIM